MVKVVANFNCIPDEFAQYLTDHRARGMWDMNSDSIQKKDQNGDHLNISYSMKENGELHSTLE